jgi:hypothetical protein
LIGNIIVYCYDQGFVVVVNAVGNHVCWASGMTKMLNSLSFEKIWPGKLMDVLIQAELIAALEALCLRIFALFLALMLWVANADSNETAAASNTDPAAHA